MEVCLQFQFVEVEPCRFQEAVFEIVQVEEHAIGVKLWLRVAVVEVESPCSPYLYVWQFANGSDEQLFLA